MDGDEKSVKNADVPQLVAAFQRYRKLLARVVARIVRPQDIEDIVQETYLRLYRASQRQKIFHPRSFMLKTARNIALNHVARADAMNHLQTPAAGTALSELEDEASVLQSMMGESLETQFQGDEEFLIFCRAVRELPLHCRRAFILKKVYGMSQKEVAAQLGISEATVEQHIVKGIVVCTAYMRKHGYLQTRDHREQRVK